MHRAGRGIGLRRTRGGSPARAGWLARARLSTGRGGGVSGGPRTPTRNFQSRGALAVARPHDGRTPDARRTQAADAGRTLLSVRRVLRKDSSRDRQLAVGASTVGFERSGHVERGGASDASGGLLRTRPACAARLPKLATASLARGAINRWFGRLWPVVEHTRALVACVVVLGSPLTHPCLRVFIHLS